MRDAAPRTVELDVRPYLRKKLEPFQVIMDTVKSLNPDDTFVLHATFKPTPLLGLMKMRGYRNEIKQVEPDHWIVTFWHKSRKEGPAKPSEAVLEIIDVQIDADSEPGAAMTDDKPESAPSVESSIVTELDNRGLQPPQPMVRTLQALERCKPGEMVRIHNDRVPMFLIEELNTMNCTYEVEPQPDGSAKVTIRKG